MSLGRRIRQYFHGGDLDGSTPNPTVRQARGLRETAGPTTLTMGAVADGQFLSRSGSSIVGATPSSGPTTEQIQDIVGAMIVGGTDIDATYDDGAGTVTIDNTGGGGSSTFVGGGFEQWRLIGVNSRPNASTTPDTYGHAAVTPTADNATNSDDANGPFRRYDTAASNTTTASISFNNGGLVRTAWLPQVCTKLKTHSSIAVCRVWVGFISGGAPSADDPAQHGAAFRYSTAAGDTNWQAWTNDGSGGGTITDTGVAVATSTLYHFAVVVESTASITFYISTDNGVTYNLVATHTTNLPTSSQGMDYYFQMQTLENVAKSIHHSYTYIRMR